MTTVSVNNVKHKTIRILIAANIDKVVAMCLAPSCAHEHDLSHLIQRILTAAL